MNICFLVSNINPSIGGTERVTQSIAYNLQSLGYKSYFIFTNIDNPSIERTFKMRCDTSASIDVSIQAIIEFLKKNHIKVLIVVNRIFQSHKWQRIFEKVKLKYSVKIIISLHAAPDNWVNKNKYGLVLPRVYLKEWIKKQIFRLYNPHVNKVVGSYNIADKYLLLSPSYIKMFVKTYHIKDNGKKLIAIPNPCPFKDKVQETRKEKIVLVVSRMQEDQKRIFCLLKIWKAVCNKHKDWKLLIVGTGPDILKYKKYASKISNVTFEGHSSHVQDYYKQSKIFLMTSIWEGLPMTLIEAMHYGCIPVAFDSFAALHDIIDNGQTGFIIQNNDINSFVEILNRLMGCQNLCDNIANNIIKMPNKFQMNDILKIWDKELKDICNENK